MLCAISSLPPTLFLKGVMVSRGGEGLCTVPGRKGGEGRPVYCVREEGREGKACLLCQGGWEGREGLFTVSGRMGGKGRPVYCVREDGRGGKACLLCQRGREGRL